MEQRKTFTDQCRVWFRSFGEICSRFLLRIGLSANAVTIIGCAGHLFAAYLAAIGQFQWAGVLLVFFAVTDFFDGTMSRMANGGKGTKFGAVLDSTTDRYAEFMIFGGLIYYYAAKGDQLNMMISYAAIMGAILVSYTRAKGEIAGLNMKLGLMSRLERYLFLVPCLLLNIPFIAMWAIAIGSHFTAIQRIIHMYKEFKRLDSENAVVNADSNKTS
jgi:CDP-diacylglycerol--glycerol-3-phosphate 3-phosphatidyltransferase